MGLTAHPCQGVPLASSLGRSRGGPIQAELSHPGRVEPGKPACPAPVSGPRQQPAGLADQLPPAPATADAGPHRRRAPPDRGSADLRPGGWGSAGPGSGCAALRCHARRGGRARAAPPAPPRVRPDGAASVAAPCPQRLDHIGGRAHQNRAIADQLVAACGAGIEGVAGYRQHIAPLIRRLFRGDERAGARRRLDHHNSAGHARYDAVAQRKMPRLWFQPRGCSEIKQPPAAICAISAAFSAG